MKREGDEATPILPGQAFEASIAFHLPTSATHPSMPALTPLQPFRSCPAPRYSESLSELLTPATVEPSLVQRLTLSPARQLRPSLVHFQPRNEFCEPTGSVGLV